MAVHQLKTWPEFFQAIIDGNKRHEIRKADRDFNTGDVLLLREYDPNDEGAWPDRKTRGFTGRLAVVIVKYITRGGQWGLPSDVCVMSITQPCADRLGALAANLLAACMLDRAWSLGYAAAGDAYGMTDGTEWHPGRGEPAP